MIILLKDGTQFDIKDYGLIRLFHHVPSMDIAHTSSSVEGLGEKTLSSTLTVRPNIRVEYGFRVTDIYDYYMLRDEMNELFVRDEEFYIIFKREIHKRYKVKLASSFEIAPTTRLGKFTVEFKPVSRYVESTAATIDSPEWDIAKYAWNNAIEWDNGNVPYEFDTNEFTVHNFGNVLIDPRENELEIILKGTFSDYVKITNLTTGDIYQYNGALSSTDTLVLSDVRSLKNDVSVFRDTNKKLIRLAKKENRFLVEGGTVESIAFKFRYLFK